MAPQISFPATLSRYDIARVRDLAVQWKLRYRRVPLSDQGFAHLRSPSVRHVTAAEGNSLVGYAQLDGVSLELIGEGEVATALLDALEPLPAGTRIWSHGVDEPLAELLPARGLVPVRTLHQLRLRLADDPPQRELPPGVGIRAFVVGEDEDAWLRVNARAFAHHPEQGHWTREDLLARESEDWFDPAGFLLAEREDGQLIGFHWTKLHPHHVGEVYVLGIDPDAQGGGLGSVLLGAGLHHLAGRGVHDVLLYVDDDNPAATQLYRAVGFEPTDRDVQWAAPSPPCDAATST